MHKLIARMQEIEEMMDTAQGKQLVKYESMFVTCMRNIAKNGKASSEYESIYGATIQDHLSEYI